MTIIYPAQEIFRHRYLVLQPFEPCRSARRHSHLNQALIPTTVTTLVSFVASLFILYFASLLWPVRHQYHTDILADPYHEYSAANPFEARLTPELHQHQLVYPYYRPSSKPAQEGWQGGHTSSTPPSSQATLQSNHPRRLPGAVHQVDLHYSPTQYIQHTSISQLQPSQYALTETPPQQSFPRGTKRSRTVHSGPAGGQTASSLLPDSPSTMAPNEAFHPSFHPSSHIDQFLSHDVSEAHYEPLDMQQHHHHCLPVRNDGLAHMSQSTPPELMAGMITMVEQEGTPEPGSRPKGPKLKFSAQEDQMLIDLKENRNLTWRRIAEFFPGRTSGTLQVRYCTKLKEKTVIWTEENVQRLRKAMVDYENDKWRVISAKVGNNFSPIACQEKAEELEYEEEYEEATSSDSLPAVLGPSQPYTMPA